MRTIIIGGDVLPTEPNEKLFEAGDVLELFGREIIEKFNQADYRIINLEGPLTDTDEAITKTGPNIKGSEASINAIDKLNINCIQLANNHIMDYGIKGYESTRKLLSHKGIQTVGAGKNIHEAREPVRFVLDDMKVGIYACAEYEFTIADENKAGANPYDALSCYDDISELRSQVDYIIVLYHGGKEYYRYPAPYLQRLCRKMVDKGADLIICNHSHCIGCKEEYKGGIILYGQGNFLFDRGNNEFRNSGLLVKVELGGSERRVSFLPVNKVNNGVRLADGEIEKSIIRDFIKRSKQIEDKDFVAENYKKFALENIDRYLCPSFWNLGKILRKLKVIRYFVRKKSRLVMLNIVRCEAHRDLVREGLCALLEKCP